MNNRIYITMIYFLGGTLAFLLAPLLYAQGNKFNISADVRDVTIGAFNVKVPTEWNDYKLSEVAELRRQYITQSEEIYRQFSGSEDPSNTVDIGAFHITKQSGSFIIVSFTVPPQSDLITLLESQIKNKMDWGVREGYIRQYLGILSIDDARFSGFYTKTIGNTGRVQVSGALEHKKLRNTIIQLTLLCPKAWEIDKAINTLNYILKSVMLNVK